MKKTFTGLAGALSLLLFIAFLFVIRRTTYNEYHQSAINGHIDTIYCYKSYFMMHVNGVEFRIIPIPAGHMPRFEVAAKGDSIYKAANNDTLMLFKQGELLKYTVQKY